MNALLRAFVTAGLLMATGMVARAAEFSYASFDTVLARHVNGGVVDYGALARDPGPLQRFLASARDVDPSLWPREARFAFWVNVYNARVLDGVVRRPGLKSVLDVGKALGVPTLGFFRERQRTAGSERSLSDIEHQILRKGFREPRVHFVLNCASASCPPIPARALQSAGLDSTLDAATRAFLADQAKNPGLHDREIRLSAIFKWYREDFDVQPGGLVAFLQRHGGAPARLPGRTSFHFIDYDWSLNGHW